MLQKIKQWFERRKLNKTNRERFDRGLPLAEMFSREQLEKAFILGYNDGKRDGLTIAREQATKSLKEILWQQNNQTPKK